MIHNSMVHYSCTRNFLYPIVLYYDTQHNGSLQLYKKKKLFVSYRTLLDANFCSYYTSFFHLNILRRLNP